MTNRDPTLVHEAGHVVGAMLAGHRIKAVGVGANGRSPRGSGRTLFDWAASPEVDFYGRLIGTLMGPMAEGGPPPAWPPAPQLDGTSDEHVASILVRHLDLSKNEYMATAAIAGRWLGDPLVRLAIAKVSKALGEAGAVNDAMVRELLGPELVGWFEMGPRPEGAQLCAS